MCRAAQTAKRRSRGSKTELANYLVTTGAFYGYYSSKDALFTALVEPHAAVVMGMFMRAQTAFSERDKV